MTRTPDQQHRTILHKIARRVMIEKGLVSTDVERGYIDFRRAGQARRFQRKGTHGAKTE